MEKKCCKKLLSGFEVGEVEMESEELRSAMTFFGD
jgi:hypothetical protein